MAGGTLPAAAFCMGVSFSVIVGTRVQIHSCNSLLVLFVFVYADIAVSTTALASAKVNSESISEVYIDVSLIQLENLYLFGENHKWGVSAYLSVTSGTPFLEPGIRSRGVSEFLPGCPSF